MTPHRDRLLAGDYDPGKTATTTPTGEELDGMTKAELVAYGEQIGAEVDSSATKADVRAAIDKARGGV